MTKRINRKRYRCLDSIRGRVKAKNLEFFDRQDNLTRWQDFKTTFDDTFKKCLPQKKVTKLKYFLSSVILNLFFEA